MSKKIKRGHLDGYLTGDLFMFLFIIALAKENFKTAFLLLATGSIFYFIAASVLKNRVYNSTGSVMFAMDENDHEKIFVLPAGKEICNVDGVNINGTVYKIPDGVNAVATKNGIRIFSAMGNIVYYIGGGEKGTLPEPSWQKLFQAHLS
jgi:hypothetical protein